jgi:serine/threonine protein kinase
MERRKPSQWRESEFLSGGEEYDAPCNPADIMEAETILTHRYVTVDSGSHLDLDSLGFSVDQLPYRYIKMLGRGGSASVEMVKDANTGSVYARKIVRNVYTRNLKEARKLLHNEVQIMGKLKDHHHIAKVHATYIAKRELAIILSPVADGGDLASYLQERRDNSINGFQPKPDEILQRSFGCLASGLAYIHSQTIRHKDVKPQNILIHKETVMFTDFGLSYDFADAGQSTTTGPVQGLTRRYCAPEIAEGRGRNSSSDIFSLGCVYLEIVDSLYAGYIEEDLLAGPFYEKLRMLDNGFWVRADKAWKPVISLLKGLLSHEPSGRPSANEVVSLWFNLSAEQPQNEYFCIPCFHTRSSSSQSRIRNMTKRRSSSQEVFSGARNLYADATKHEYDPPSSYLGSRHKVLRSYHAICGPYGNNTTVLQYTLKDFTMYVGIDQNQPVHWFTQLDIDGRLSDLNLTIPQWQSHHPEFDFLRSKMNEWKQDRHILVCSASLKIMNELRPNVSLSIECSLGTQQDLSGFESIYCITRFYDSGNIEPDLLLDVKDIRNSQEYRTPCEYRSDSRGRNSSLRVAFGSKFWVTRMTSYQRLMQTDESSVRKSLLQLTATQDIYGENLGLAAECLPTILWRFDQTMDSAEVGRVNWHALNLSSVF